MSKLIPYFTGESSTYTVTSAYGTFAEVSGVARNLIFELYLAPATCNPIDFRLVQAMPRLTAATSDLNFQFAATTLTNKSSDFTKNITKGCYVYALQAKQSTAATDFAATIQAKWIGVS